MDLKFSNQSITYEENKVTKMSTEEINFDFSESTLNESEKDELIRLLIKHPGSLSFMPGFTYTCSLPQLKEMKRNPRDVRAGNSI